VPHPLHTTSPTERRSGHPHQPPTATAASKGQLYISSGRRPEARSNGALLTGFLWVALAALVWASTWIVHHTA